MARGTTRRWLTTATSAALLLSLVALTGTPAGAQTRSSRAHDQLTAGIECQRRGDYELAASLFQQAQVGQDYLTATERQELANRIQSNDGALKARGEGADQVRRAEEACKAGHTQEALELLNALSGNQFLTAADKQRVSDLRDKLRPAAAAAPAGTPGFGAPIVKARAKLQQARALMAKGDFAAAEALAAEADALGAVYQPTEDTPSKVRADVAKARTAKASAPATPAPGAKLDGAGMVAAGRTALQKGDLDAAEGYAKDAQKAESRFAMHMPWNDSPGKLLNDVQAARLKRAAEVKVTPPAPNGPNSTKPQGPAVAQGPGAPKDAGTSTGPGAMKPGTPGTTDKPAPGSQVASAAPKPRDPGIPPLPPAPAVDSNPDATRQMLRDGRKALQDGNLDKAKECCEAAAKRKPNLEFWEDNPEKLRSDIKQAEARKGTAVAQVAAKPAQPQAKPGDNTPADAQSLLRQGRELFNAGKLGEAREAALKANGVYGAHWGLFGDSPDKLLVDIQKAQVAKDQKESAQLLADGRQLFAQAKYDEAEKKAYRAEYLHGEYNLWDLGDRPKKLLADIQSARAKERKLTIPAPKDVAVAQGDPNKSTFIGGSGKPNSGVSTPQGPAVTNNAPKPTPTPTPTPGSMATNTAPPPDWSNVPNTPPTPVQTANSTPTTTGSQGPAVGVISVSPPTPSVGEMAVANLAKQNAVKMMVEVRAMQKEGRLIEAKSKAMEAMKLGVTFGPDEDRPERAMLELAQLCDRRIELLMQEATDFANTATQDPSRLQKAETDLSQARLLAAGFGLDTANVDRKLEWVKGLETKTVASAPNAPNVPNVLTQPTQVQPAVGQVAHVEPEERARGLTLLDKARLELKRGECETARRLAVEARTGPYNVQKEADALLRSIDTEEWNQKGLAANRAFESGRSAYQQKRYVEALGIFRELDPRMLTQENHARLKDIMLSQEMVQVVAAQTPASPEGPPSGEPVPVPVPGGVKPTTGEAPVVQAPQRKVEYAAEVKALQDVKFDEMRQKALRAQQDATERFQAGAYDQAMDILQSYKGELENSNLDPDRANLLRRPLDDKIQKFKTMRAQAEFNDLIKQKEANTRGKESRYILAEEAKHKQAKELMDQYNALRKEGKYREAEMAAVKAREIDPDNPVIDAAIYTARIMINQQMVQEGKRHREDMFTNTLNNVEDPGPEVRDGREIIFDKDWSKKGGKRTGYAGQQLGHKTEKEREIERKLQLPVNVEFKDMPLKDVVDQLRSEHSLNIVIDQSALDDRGISINQPLSEKLENISLKAALNILLKRLHLTYVIADEVLQITTEENSKGRQVQRTFAVADLIIPVDNYIIPASSNLQRVMAQGANNTLQLNGVTTPRLGSGMTGSGIETGVPGGPDRTFASIQTGQAPPNNTTLPASTRAPGQTNTMEDLLIKLITNTIKPQSWADVGGQGTIDYFPLGMALVINQTPDVQEQVQELLDALRRLQDLEVSVEVRMISLSEAFFERIGLNFNINIDPKVPRRFQEQIVTQQFQPLNQVNNPTPISAIFGLTPAGTPTSSLFIPIQTSSYDKAIPPFGGYPGIPGADGGISMGLAFLSDIQVFMFMEAAQGDRRMNVMQAPKLTLFNGQTSTIQIQDFQYFITNVQVVQSGGQIVFVPQNQPIPLGVNLAVQAVVSADRRFVRLNLAPTLTNLANANVPLFPITTFITPVFEGGAQGQPIPFTQFLQQPTFTTVTIQTTVSVPDGGTVLLGGLKLLNEGRNEFGPPVLSKVPYLDRLFKNVGYGRDTSSLLIMVTPRVIINAEEELIQTGVNSGGPGGGPATGLNPNP